MYILCICYIFVGIILYTYIYIYIYIYIHAYIYIYIYIYIYTNLVQYCNAKELNGYNLLNKQSDLLIIPDFGINNNYEFTTLSLMNWIDRIV